MTNRPMTRALRGAPASVLLALLEQPGAASAADLALLTGYSINAVKTGAALLERYGLIARANRSHGAAWALLAGAAGAAFPALGGASTDKLCQLTPPDINAATAAINPHEGTSSSSSSGAAIDTIAELLTAAGIGRNSPAMRALLAAGLSADYVRAHIAAWKRDNGAGVGLLIRRMLDGDAAPVCRCGRCGECRARAYADFGDIIER